MSTLSVVFVTISRNKAQLLAKKIISSRLAACVNIIPSLISVYRWDNKVQKSTESLLIIKARSKSLPRLFSFIACHHPYQVPEIIAIPISQIADSYLKWVLNETLAH